jgi:hypothetical protein
MNRDALLGMFLAVVVAVVAGYAAVKVIDSLDPPPMYSPHEVALVAAPRADDLDEFVPTPHHLYSRPREESYDQENLHKLAGQRGGTCAAVYDAPHGKLRFCL